MTDNSIYKIKDSVDLFLSNDKYIMAYYMNTRQRKSFKINDATIHLLEIIDGKKNLLEIKKLLRKEFDINEKTVEQVIIAMEKNRIITEIIIGDEILDRKYVERFARQINYFAEFLNSEREGLLAQKKLMETKILLFGCGAVGGDIALELAMAGCGDITIYDYDTVEDSDVSRHMYFREEYCGFNKTDALKKELKKINSEIIVNVVNESMKPKTDIENLIKNADFVINTMDEPYIGYTSSKISRICVKYRIPHFIAGGFDAHLASTGELIIPYVTPCVECYASHFKKKLKDWKPREHPVKERYNEIGGLSSMSLFSASYACIEIIKFIAGLVNFKNNYKVRGEFLFTDMSLTYLDVKKNNKCPICGGINV